MPRSPYDASGGERLVALKRANEPKPKSRPAHPYDLSRGRRIEMTDTPYDPVTGRAPVDPDDTRDPTTIPMWSIGGFGRPVGHDDKTGVTEVEARIIGSLEEAYKRLQRAERGTQYWGELLHQCRGINTALQCLYSHPWKDNEDPSKGEDDQHSWNNEGCSHAGWRLQLDWQARLY